MSNCIRDDGDKFSTTMISDMVVLPVVDMRTSANGQLSSMLSHTRTKLVPRKGVTDAWYDDLNDVLSSHKLTKITNELRPPLLQELIGLLPGVPANMIEALGNAIHNQWWTEATTLYQIVRASIDLSGIFEKKDLSMIKANFIAGDYRDGPALLRWAMSFTNMDSVGEQAKLIAKVMNAKMPLNPSQEQFGQHVADLLIDWLAVKGNDERNPASYYHTLLRSFPDVTSGPLWHLKAWLSDRISDDDPLLKSPSEFIDKFTSRANNLGLVSNPNSVNAVTATCEFCPSRLCKGAKRPSQCLGMNPNIKRPANAQDGQWRFVELLRAYCAAVKNVKTLKGMSVEKLQNGIRAAGKEPPTNSKPVAGHSTGGGWLEQHASRCAWNACAGAACS